MFNFTEATTADSFTLSEMESDFKITATKDGVMMSGTSPMFQRHSHLEGLGAAMGKVVRWHLNRAEAEKALKLTKQAEETPDATEAAGKF